MLRRKIGELLEWFLTYNHEVKISCDEGAQLPFRKYAGDAGYDLYAYEDLGLPPHSTADVRSGVYLDSKSQLWLEIKARSSTLKVKELEVVDAVIDRGYRGEMLAIVHNPTGKNKFIRKGERIAQIVPHHLIPLQFRTCEKHELSPSDRAMNGFGSSGK